MKRSLSLALALALLLCAAACAPSRGKLRYGRELLAVGSQLDALNGLLKGDADIAVIDSVMAGYYLNSVDTFRNFTVLDGAGLSEGAYAAAAAKGNRALIGKINEALIALADTEYAALGAKYGLSSELLIKADTPNPDADADDGSWVRVAASGKLIVGYTLYAPIAFFDGDGPDARLVGFDIELPQAAVAYLNRKYGVAVEAEFLQIEWEQKETLLANGTVDLVWNGLSVTPDRAAAMALSLPYMSNNQVPVVSKADAAAYACDGYDSFVEKVRDAVVIVEKGSDAEATVHDVR